MGTPPFLDTTQHHNVQRFFLAYSLFSSTYFKPPPCSHTEVVTIVLAAKALPMRQLLQRLPATPLALRLGRDRRQLWCIHSLLQVPPKLNSIVRNFTQPAFLWFLTARIKLKHLPEHKQHLQVLL